MITRIRRTVKDPAVAEQLIPDYPVFCKRTPIVDDYCIAPLHPCRSALLLASWAAWFVESLRMHVLCDSAGPIFNESNVTLVHDARGVQKITEQGPLSEDGVQYDVDVIVYATGFDAWT